MRTGVESVSRAFGGGLAARFWLDEPKAHVTRGLRRGLLAVTQIRSSAPTPEPSQSIGYDEAYLIGLMVEDVPNHELWQDGRSVRTEPFAAGQTALYDLRRDPISFTRTAHHSLHFYMPRVVLRDLADRAGMRFTGELDYRFAHGHDDPVIRDLGRAVLPALVRGDTVSGLHVDHVLHAVAAHVLGHYGHSASLPEVRRSGLTKRQLRVAQEMMTADLTADVSLADLAAACTLSVPHFARAFRQSTGVAPHRWLIGQRIEQAMLSLRNNEARLADVAIDCGFADQSHFSRAFAMRVGVSPGQWRRAQS